MTKFDKEIIKKMNKVETKEQIVADKERVVDWLMRNMLDSNKSFFSSKALKVATLWIKYSKEGLFIFDLEDINKSFKSINEINEFVAKVKKLFPSDYIECNIIDEYTGKNVKEGTMVVGLQFFLDIEKMKKEYL